MVWHEVKCRGSAPRRPIRYMSLVWVVWGLGTLPDKVNWIFCLGIR